MCSTSITPRISPMCAAIGPSRTPRRWEPLTHMYCRATMIDFSAFGLRSPVSEEQGNADAAGPHAESNGKTARVFVTRLHRFGARALDRISLGSRQQAFDDPRQVVAHRLARTLRIVLAQRRQNPPMLADPRLHADAPRPLQHIDAQGRLVPHIPEVLDDRGDGRVAGSPRDGDVKTAVGAFSFLLARLFLGHFRGSC